MPGDLEDQTQFFPHYTEKLYNPATTVFDDSWPESDADKYIQGIAVEILGVPLDNERLKSVLTNLRTKGYLHRNYGDEDFKREVKTQINRIKSARRVLHARYRFE